MYLTNSRDNGWNEMDDTICEENIFM